MNTITYFKIFVVLFVTYCTYEFFLKDLYAIIRSSLFSRMSRITTLILIVISTSATLNFAQNKSQTIVYREAQAASLIPEADQISLKNGNTMPSSVRLKKSSKISKTAFVPWLKKSLKLSSQNDFVTEQTKTDDTGMEHIWMQQILDGIPVKDAVYIVHVKNGNVTSFNGFAVNQVNNTEKTPVISEAAALEQGLSTQDVEKLKYNDPFWEKDIKDHSHDHHASYAPVGKLMWWKNKSGQLIKIYQFDIYAAKPDKAFRMLVNAATGVVENTIPLESNCNPTTVNTIFNGNRAISTDLHTAEDFRVRDNCDAAIIHIRDWGSDDCDASPFEIENTDNVWNTQDEIFAGTVLWYTKEAYHYWQDEHSRNSYDDANGTVNGYINAVFDGNSADAGCQPSTNNASMSFSGGTMKVGSGGGGPLTNSYATLDIIGHEYAHAVTGSSAGLEYQNESGALNESFSDIFGEALERYTTGSNDWLMGAERDNGHIRNLSDPNDNGDPDTYLGTNWYSGPNDNGGVHTNSGVQNFWFYLLSEGGTGTNDNGDDYTVVGIGFDKAAQICYDNLIFYLGTTSDYADARDGTIQMVSNQWGDCSAEMKAVMNAWYAVGVGDEFPKATVGVSDQSVCVGESISLFASGGVSYSWSGPGGFTSNVQNPVRNNLQVGHSGTYSVTVTFSNGCTGSTGISVTVHPLPVPTASATPNPVCSGKTVNFSSGGGATYLWSGPLGFTSNSQNFVVGNVQVAQAGIYTVTVTSADGCSATKTVDLAVNLSPVPTASATPNPVCVNDKLLLKSSGGVSYKWSGPNGFTSTTKDPAIFVSSELFEGLYTVTVTSAAGCFETANVNVVVNPIPVGTISALPANACVGSPVQLTATGGVSYLWTGPQGFTSNIAAPSLMINAYNQRGEYKVKITNEFGCSITLTKWIEVYFPPVATASHDLTTACTGSPLKLIGGGLGTVAWTGPNGFTSNVLNPVIPNASSLHSGIYTIKVTSPNGCTATATTSVTIVAPPVVSAIASDYHICEGSGVQFNANGGVTYKWSGPYGYKSSLQNPYVANVPSYMSGAYTMTADGVTGCKSSAGFILNVYNQVAGSANASPNPISTGNNLQLSATGGSNYLWSGPNGFYSTEQNPVIYNAGFQNVGSYVVIVTNAGGCENAYFVNVTLKNSTFNISANSNEASGSDSYPKLYPNPARDFINLGYTGINNVEYRIVDASGAVVLKNVINANKQIDVRALPSGYFTIIWKENDQNSVQQIEKFIKVE